MTKTCRKCNGTGYLPHLAERYARLHAETEAAHAEWARCQAMWSANVSDMTEA